MDEPDNIDRFNRVAAHMFSELYAAFPSKRKANPTQVASQVFEIPLREVTKEDALFVSESLQWLEQAGYVWPLDRWKGKKGQYGAVLSDKGIAALRQERLIEENSSESFGAGLSRAIRSNSPDIAGKIVTELLLAAPRFANALS